MPTAVHITLKDSHLLQLGMSQRDRYMASKCGIAVTVNELLHSVAEVSEVTPFVRLSSSKPLPTDASAQARWFAEDIQPHEGALRAYLRCRFPMLHDLDDLVQEAYMRLIRAYNAGSVTSSKSMLFAIARNAALDLFRRQKAVPMDSTADFDDFSGTYACPNAADKASQAQEIDLLYESIRALPERCRQVVTLRMICGLSHKEIAKRLGISAITVNNQLTIGLERCRRFLVRKGVNGCVFEIVGIG